MASTPSETYSSQGMYKSAMSTSKWLQEREGEWTGPRQVMFCGIRVPGWVSVHPDTEKDLPHFPTRKDDVFIVSFPKSGTTWMQEIVWQIFHNGQVSMERISDRIPYVLACKLLDNLNTGDEKQDGHVVLENLPNPRLIKSHLPYHVIPKGNSETTECKYIYIGRNPKDVAVSYYHHVKGFPEEKSGFRGPFEFCASLFLQGKSMYGFWLDHVLGWWKHKDDPNILFLKYEDLKKDLEENVRKIAEFLEKVVSEETVKRIAKQCTFQEMAKSQSVYTYYGSSPGPKFIRKGKVGDWKNHFSPELDSKFETELVAKLEGTGLQFEFTEEC